MDMSDRSQMPWQLATEHRLTVLEVFAERQREINTHVRKKLTLQERGLLLIIVALNALAHEKLPEWAKYLAAVLKMGSAL